LARKPVDTGAVAQGLRADLLLVHGDPMVDINAIHRIVQVVHGGVRLDRLLGETASE